MQFTSFLILNMMSLSLKEALKSDCVEPPPKVAHSAFRGTAVLISSGLKVERACLFIPCIKTKGKESSRGIVGLSKSLCAYRMK